LFNRQYFNRGKFNVSALQLAISGVAALVLVGNVKGSLMLQAPPSLVNIKLNAYGKQTMKLNAPDIAAELQLGAGGQSTNRLFAAGPASDFTLDASGLMKLVITAPDSAAEMQLDSIGLGFRRYYADSPEVASVLGLSGRGSRIMFADLPAVMFKLYLRGESLRKFLASTPSVPINLNTKGSAVMFGYSTLFLPDLVVPPDGELVIDTENMTITLNGENVTRFFGQDSEFFKLKPGENIVIYEDGEQNRDISYKILWKDLWL